MTTHGGQGNDDSHSIAIASFWQKSGYANYKPSTNVQDYLQRGLEKGYARDAFWRVEEMSKIAKLPRLVVLLAPVLEYNTKNAKIFFITK